MKLRTFLSIFLFCSPLLALGTNNLTVARAESASENLVVYDDSTTKFSEEFGWFKASGAVSSPVINGAYLQLTGGAYIESLNPYYVDASQPITFKIDKIATMPNKTNTSNGNRLTFSVLDIDGNVVDTITIKPSKTTNAELSYDFKLKNSGQYYFRITSDVDASTASRGKYTRIYKTHITYTPYVEQPATPDISSDKFATEKTLSQMAFSYTKSVEGETTSYNVDEVVLRYGAKVDYTNMWSSLDVKGYGVAVAKTNDLDGSSLTDLLNNKDLSDETVRAENENIKFAVGDLENVTRVNENDGLLVEDLEGQYVLFNARIVVPESDYDTAVSALAYVVFEEDGMNKLALFQEVVGDSVANEANYYLNNGEQYNADVRNVLSSLAD